MNRFSSKKSALILLVLLFSIAFIISCAQKAKVENDQIAYYTCSMHPEVKEKEPGKCPLCGMDLTPVMKSAEADSQKVDTPQE